MSAKINGTIINACFPRSGHRFLREMLTQYFGDEYKFLEPYTGALLIGGKPSKLPQEYANYVKNHDFKLVGRKGFREQFPLQRKYLVQVRHPLESICSYYEFSLKTGVLKSDSEKQWKNFLSQKITYWKKFCELWLEESRADTLLAEYSDLYQNTEEALISIIRFLTNSDEVDIEKLRAISKKSTFNQYVGDKNSEKSSVRDIREFKYYSETEFKKIEQQLDGPYLSKLNIKTIY